MLAGGAMFGPPWPPQWSLGSCSWSRNLRRGRSPSLPQGSGVGFSSLGVPARTDHATTRNFREGVADSSVVAFAAFLLRIWAIVQSRSLNIHIDACKRRVRYAPVGRHAQRRIPWRQPRLIHPSMMCRHPETLVVCWYPIILKIVLSHRIG